MFGINGSRRMASLVFEENGAMLIKYIDLFNSYFSSTFTNKLKDTIETPVKHYQKEWLNKEGYVHNKENIKMMQVPILILYSKA